MLFTAKLKKIVWYGLVLLTGACQFENTGTVQQSADIAKTFESLQMEGFRDYRYWFLNTENNPFGVVGLENGYWLKGDDWRECDPASSVFSKVVGLVQAFPVQGNRAEGYYILDHQKLTIGIWYSSLSAGITVDPETKRVVIATATPWLQER
jgi:hypothetical protein